MTLSDLICSTVETFSFDKLGEGNLGWEDLWKEGLVPGVLFIQHFL